MDSLWPDRRRKLCESPVKRVNIILLARYTVLPDGVEHLFNFISESVLVQETKASHGLCETRPELRVCIPAFSILEAGNGITECLHTAVV